MHQERQMEAQTVTLSYTHYFPLDVPSIVISVSVCLSVCSCVQNHKCKRREIFCTC